MNFKKVQTGCKACLNRSISQTNISNFITRLLSNNFTSDLFKKIFFIDLFLLDRFFCTFFELSCISG
jgi:hypothetical protein